MNHPLSFTLQGRHKEGIAKLIKCKSTQDKTVAGCRSKRCEQRESPNTGNWNGLRFGAASGFAMAWSFPELVAHAARTRVLCAGTIIGSGTVSNANFREVGSSCIAERRGIEIVDEGKPRTEFMRFGDTVRMEARGIDDTPLFGVIEQRVVAA